jgi:hypothetical protein
VSASAPFLIAASLGDGTVARIPAASYAELEELLGRMALVCGEARVPTPPIVLWRLDRGEPRAMSEAELEEGGLRLLPILAA